MQDEFYPSDEYETPPEPALPAGYSQRPDEIVDDASLSLAQKRAILASWASDARAVTDAPALRQLDNGDVLDIDTILDALKRLDGIPHERVLSFRPEGRGCPHRYSPARRMRRLGSMRPTDDDDPSPHRAAVRLPRPRSNLSAVAATGR